MDEIKIGDERIYKGSTGLVTRERVIGTGYDDVTSVEVYRTRDGVPEECQIGPTRWSRKEWRSLAPDAPPPAPEPASVLFSQHPADLKPRGVKAPMYLIPWAVVPEEFVPMALRDAAARVGSYPDGDRVIPERDLPQGARLPYEIARQVLKVSSLDDVARAFEHGAKKYARDNWRTFAWDDRARDEYFGAICRHLAARLDGELAAEDSGVSHYGHAGAGALIWAWHEVKIARRA